MWDIVRRYIFSLLILFFVGFSLWPTIYEIARRDSIQPNRAFELIHNFPTDYNFYLSRIRQGIEGRTMVVEQYTSEPHGGSLVHIFYLALGWIGRWVRVPWERAGDVYHIARIVFGVTLLWLMAMFTKQAFSHSRFSIVSFLLAVTASTWPTLVFYNGGWRFGGYMPWWSLMDSLQRITFIPHLLAGQALTLFLVMSTSDDKVMSKGGNWIFLGILAFVLGIIFPPGLFFVLVVMSIGEVWHIRKIWGRILSRVVIFGLALPALVYLQMITSFYPWKRLTEFDIIKPLPFNYLEYFLAVGPLLPLGLVGLIAALIRREKSMILSTAWVAAWLFLLFAFRFVPQQSPLRFSEMIPHVPLAVLSSYIFYNLYNRYKRYNRYILLFPATIIAVGLGVMLSSIWWQRDFIDHKMSASYPLVPTGSYVMYPLKDFIAAMKFLQDRTTRDTVIFSETTAGNYMPVYSGNTVYVGHANTVKAEEKEIIVRRFFSGQMKVDEAKTWLLQNNLHFIFFGPQEKEVGGVAELSKIYPFLKSIYTNNFVTVYKSQ